MIDEVTYRHQGENIHNKHGFIDASGQARLLARWWKLPVSDITISTTMPVGYWSGSSVAETEWRLRGMERWATLVPVKRDGFAYLENQTDVVSVGWVSNKKQSKKAI